MTYSSRDTENFPGNKNPFLESRASSTFVSTKSDDCGSLNATIRSLKSEIDIDISSINADLEALDKYDEDLSRPFKDGISVIKSSINRMNISIEVSSPSKLQSTFDS